MTNPRNPRRRDLRPGDRVRVPYLNGTLIATVLEDRGRIGVGGERLLRVRISLDETHFREFEVAAAEVRPVLRRAS